MQYSEVLIKILDRANEIKKDTNASCVSAPVIFAAVAELCGTKYQGITNYQSERHPVWYEEERLRYLFKKLFRASGNLVAHSIKRRISQDLSEYDVDFFETHKDALDSYMAERKLSVLTSDIVFLVVLHTFANRQNMGLHPEYLADICIGKLLTETDASIYDYVISEIAKIQEQLQKKADTAKAKRDWKPAEKFMEPEEMRERFFASVQVKIEGKSLELVLPYFYDGKRELRLTIISVDGIYYVKDNQGVMGCFCQIFTFMTYLQDLILLEVHKRTGAFPPPIMDEVEVDWSKAEAFDAEALLEELKQCIVVRYDENRGLVLSVIHMCYAGQNTSVSFVFKVWKDGMLLIHDGELGFERNEYLEKGYLSEKIVDGNYLPLLFRFFYLAVQISDMQNFDYGHPDRFLFDSGAGCY